MPPKGVGFTDPLSGTLNRTTRWGHANAIMALLAQGMDAFEANDKMTKHETFGAIGTLTSVEDTIERAKNAKLFD